MCIRDRLDQLGGLVEVAAEQALVAGGLLEQQRAALAVLDGGGIGAAGVVLHPGAQKGEALGPSIKRAAKVIAAAVEDSERCPLLLEQTAGHKGLLGRDFDQTAELIEPVSYTHLTLPTILRV